MYVREVGEQTLTFQVSGKLWGSSLVMRDKETGSEWSHILGECRSGKLKGTRLKQIPSVMTDWGTWKQKHPETTVVLASRTSDTFRRSLYNNRLDRYVLGVVKEGHAFAWRLDFLEPKGIYHDEIRKLPVLVTFDKKSITALLFDRSLDDRVLTFSQKDGVLRDKETGSQWDATTGLAVEGELKGKRLKLLPAILSFTQVWKRFHPDSKMLQ